MSKRDQIIAHYEKKIAEYEKRLTAADALAELVELFIKDPHEKIIYPAFIARSFTVYECRYCGKEERTPDKICHADDCLFERSRITLRQYREACK